MIAAIKPASRATGIGIAAAALLIGSFLLGTARSGAATGATGGGSGSGSAVLTAATGPGKITVTGTGTVTGTPDELVLSMGVQTRASSVSTALRQANEAARHVIGSLKAGGVRPADIQTSGLSISPDYRDGSPFPVDYSVSEELTATLRDLAKAGSQIQSAVTAGGNATRVNGVALNLTDTGSLLAKARTAAIRDAKAKAGQFARALGAPLGGVIRVSDQSGASYPIPLAAYGAAPRSVPVSPGTQKVSVHITVVFAIG